MSKSFDLKTHMNKSSIKELINYIEGGDTPPTCNDIYTIARGIQYMDDTYLRANTTFATVKTPVPYNEWFKCMVGKFVAKQSAITQHRIHTDRPKDNDRIIKEENAINAENELNFCKKKGCRKSEGLGICFPKSRKLNDKLSKENKTTLQKLYDAIMEKNIHKLKPIIDYAYSVEGAYENLKKYVLDDNADLNKWKICIDGYKDNKSCIGNCAIGNTPEICRPTSAKRISSEPVASYVQAYDQLANAIISEEKKKEKEQKEQEKKEEEEEANKKIKEQNERDKEYQADVKLIQNELTDTKTLQNQKIIASNINSGFDPLGVKLVGNAAVDDSHLPKYAPPRIPPVLSSLDSNAPTSGYDLSNGNRWRDPQPQPPHVRKLGGGRQTRKRKGSSSTKKHKKRTKHKKRASTKKHKKNKKRPRTRKR